MKTMRLFMRREFAIALLIAVVGSVVLKGVPTKAIAFLQQATGQSASVPMLSESDAVKLETAWREYDRSRRELMLQLKIIEQQMQLVSQPFTRPGFELQRSNEGKWSYIPTPKPSDQK